GRRRRRHHDGRRPPHPRPRRRRRGAADRPLRALPQRDPEAARGKPPARPGQQGPQRTAGGAGRRRHPAPPQRPRPLHRSTRRTGGHQRLTVTGRCLVGWRDTARNTRRALKTTVVARELWGQTNDPQDAHKALEAATYLMRFANSLYAQIASDIRAAEEAAHTLRSEEHTSELQSRENLVCRLLLEKKKDTDPKDRKNGHAKRNSSTTTCSAQHAIVRGGQR